MGLRTVLDECSCLGLPMLALTACLGCVGGLFLAGRTVCLGKSYQLLLSSVSVLLSLLAQSWLLFQPALAWPGGLFTFTIG